MMDFIVDLARFIVVYIVVFALNVVLFGGLIFGAIYYFGGPQ